MGDGDALYDQFLGELSALDSFLTRRLEGRARTRPPGSAGADGDDAEDPQRLLPLSRHDPDVRRLLEGMAYLSARTRMLAVEGLRDAVNRLNCGYFDFLLSASPAAALVQAVPGKRMAGPATLPRGTELRLATPEGAVGLFTTTRDLTVFPLAVGQVRRVRLTRGGSRILLRLDCQGKIAEGTRIDPLSLRINDVDDYPRSRRLLALLAHTLRAISVIFDPAEIDEDTAGIPCAHAFRAPQGIDLRENDLPDVPGDDLRTHPLGRVRSFFHFPAQQLFLDVALPPLPKSLKSATLLLDVDENWPESQVLHQDNFQLFEVPVQNLRSDLAKPILCDGTEEGYLVEGVASAVVAGIDQLPAEAIELHSITGVYRKTPRGPVPIPSALLSDHGDTWEVEERGDDPDHLQRRLLLDLEGAFDTPVGIVVEGLWYQPGFDVAAKSRLDVALQKRSIEGLSFRLAGDLEPHQPSPLWNDPLELLHLLSLRSNVLLGKDEVVALLKLLGVDRQSPHAPALDLVSDVIAHEVPGGPGARGDGVSYVYEIVLRGYRPEVQGLVDDIEDQIFALLDAWLPGAVQVRVQSATRRLPAGGRGS